MPSMLEIQVAYATQDKYKVIALCVPEGTTLEQAILLSSIQTYFPELNPVTQQVGIFGELKDRNEPIKAGDRVEIYRPLNRDPIVSRKQRVKQERALKRRLRQQRQKADRT